ncbi:uncharacterized protein LOC119688812 [Teleopsis dalmanni]|uniref:uncharacterized protein LOC119688812 n=1 Tax=Teleopsis dalmanni TaxID=139649 RepID=UPI0018CDBD11|nr:uncharacterized protein LOC119688812 [Teleopsis dalmanni]
MFLHGPEDMWPEEFNKTLYNLPECAELKKISQELMLKAAKDDTEYTRQTTEILLTHWFTLLVMFYELENSVRYIVKSNQAAEFKEEVTDLKHRKLVKASSLLAALTPFLDEYDIVRVGGRLDASNLTYNAKHQMLLPYNDCTFKLLMKKIQEENKHCGGQALLATRQKFWPIKEEKENRILAVALQETIKQMEKSKVDVLAVQEVRWQGCGEIECNDTKFRFSGDAERSASSTEQEPESTLDEFTDAIKQMKNGKSPGEDSISAELIKHCGESSKMELFTLIKRVWAEESLLEAWLTSVVVPLHKEGDKLDCNNYRGITLLSTCYKIFTCILNKRLKNAAEEILGEYQGGFRPNRSTTDQIFLLKHNLEMSFEFNALVHMLFIDFNQAFDSIDRKMIQKALQSLGINQKLIKLIMITLCNTTGKVIVQDSLTDAFEFKSGVKQGKFGYW